jgi:hypothetical protein
MLLPLSAHISSLTVHLYLQLWYQTESSAAGKTSVNIYDLLQGFDVPDRAGVVLATGIRSPAAAICFCSGLTGRVSRSAKSNSSACLTYLVAAKGDLEG